jgi:type II secretory pathway pseudopilin PulG
MAPILTRSRAAFSLAELLMAMTVFSMLVLLSVSFLKGSQGLWRKVDSSASAGTALNKACWWLQRDLDNAGQTGVATAGNGAGDARLGDALWMLSAIDPATGQFVRSSGGSALWQKNVLYYLTTPLDHDSRYGVSCQQWDRVCPHKILLRKVIDTGPPTGPASPYEERETLLSEAEITAYLTRPPSMSLSGMQGEPGVVSVEYVVGGLLDTRVTLDFEGAKVSRASWLVEAALTEDARSKLVVGRDPFPSNSMTLSRTVVVLPSN